MSSIEGIDKIGEQAAKIDIQGPETSEPHQEWELRTNGERADIVGVTDRDEDADELMAELGRQDLEIDRAAATKQDTELFDRSAYVAVPEIDGQTTDKLVIAFSGSVAYDATDEAGAAMFNDLALGKAVELRVAGYVAAKQGAYRVTATEEEVVTGKATIKVDTLYLLTPENLI